MNHVLPLLCALPFAVSPAAVAQEQHETPMTPPGISREALRVPVHSGTAAHDPDYGTWAAGPGFKASFHDGFAFYPELGPAYPENLPLHWRTARVLAGGAPLPMGPSPVIHSSDWRVEMLHAGWREVYDVRADGVEQSFVIEERPASAGDLVIRGRVTTRLVGDQVESAHGGLVFRDDAGRPIVAYGAAFAIDAAGRRVAVETSFDGDEIGLLVRGPWLAAARFPVTVDPLTTSVVLNQIAGASIGSTDVCSEMSQVQARDTVTAYSRIFSQTDHDVFAIASSADFQNQVPIFSDLSPLFLDHVTVAFVGSTVKRWLIGFETPAQITIYFHDLGDTNLNSGTSANLVSGHKPDLGGATSGTLGMLVFTYQDRMVFSILIDAAARTVLLSSLLEVGSVPAGSSYRRDSPAVIQTSTNAGWLIVWQELNLQVTGSRWYLNSTLSTRTTNSSAILLTSGTQDLVQPRVAGSWPDYLVTFVRSQALLTQLQAMRVSWPTGVPTVGSARTIATAVPPSSTLDNTGLAFDSASGAFGAATYLASSIGRPTSTVSARIARLSINGSVTESATLYSVAGRSALAPSVTFAWPAHSFPAVWGTDESGEPLKGSALLYPSSGSFPYGTACTSAAIEGHWPIAGNQLFKVDIWSAPPHSPTVLFVGLGPATVPLGGLGMPGCTFLIDPARVVFGLAGTTDQYGVGSIPLPLPDAPVVTGDLYFQYFHLAFLTNPANLLATKGLRTQVR